MGPAILRSLLLLSVAKFDKDPLRNATHTGIPSGFSALTRWPTLWVCPTSAYVRSWTSATNVTGSSYHTNGRKLIWELMQWVIPDHCPSWWFALYGYLQESGFLDPDSMSLRTSCWYTTSKLHLIPCSFCRDLYTWCSCWWWITTLLISLVILSIYTQILGLVVTASWNHLLPAIFACCKSKFK